MYMIYLDGKLLYIPDDSGEHSLTSAVLEQEINQSGSLKITIPISNSEYVNVKPYHSIITVLDDDELIFKGRVIETSTDFWKNMNVVCEGELAFFNDSIQRPAEYHDVSVRSFLEILINKHNAQVEEDKRFKLGAVTVEDSNDSLYRYTNYENTKTCINEKLIKTLGGYLFIRHESDGTYVDYLKDFPNTCSQKVEFGENLLDYASGVDTSTICTRLIPLGSRLEESQFTSIDERLTIKSVNNNVDYIQSDEAISKYGIITNIQTWDDVTVAQNLLEKAQDYLESVQWENMSISVTAVDLHAIDKSINPIKIGDNILVSSAPHGMKRWFPVTKKSTDLFDASKNKITLGTKIDISLSAKSNQAAVKAENAADFTKSQVLDSAKSNASELIKSATSGYIKLQMSEDGTPYELLIMDTDSIETATRVWRWNLNGLGYSSDGYEGEYGLAMNMDGSIVADFITSGTMTADRIRGGVLEMGGFNDEKGSAFFYDKENKKCLEITSDGLYSTDGDKRVCFTGKGAWKDKNAEIIHTIMPTLNCDSFVFGFDIVNEDDESIGQYPALVFPIKNIEGYNGLEFNFNRPINLRNEYLKNACAKDSFKVNTGTDVNFYSKLDMHEKIDMHSHEIKDFEINNIVKVNGHYPVTATYKVVSDVSIYDGKVTSVSYRNLIFNDGILCMSGGN